MSQRLPALRRTRRKINITSLAGRVFDGVAKVDATVEPYAQWWDEWNDEALSQRGPLWVALGDSVTQGIGASHPSRGYAIRTLERMREDTGEPWRLINLSMSGGRFQDVVDHQLPIIDAYGLTPQALSVVIGSNDVIWRRNTRRIVEDAQALVDALPADALLSTVAGSNRERRRAGVNRVFNTAATAGRVNLFDAWNWPRDQHLWAEDKFHPNDNAYHHLHENLYVALRSHRILS